MYLQCHILYVSQATANERLQYVMNKLCWVCVHFNMSDVVGGGGREAAKDKEGLKVTLQTLSAYCAYSKAQLPVL